MFTLNVEVSGVLPTSRLAVIAEGIYTQALREAGDIGLKRIKSRMVSDNINASEETSKQIEVSQPFHESLDRLSVEIGAVGDRAKILEFIEYGRPAGGMPPVFVIAQWMQDKGIVTADISPSHLMELAGAIARKIADQGTTGHLLFTKTAEGLQDDPQIVGIFERATAHIVEIMNSDGN